MHFSSYVWVEYTQGNIPKQCVSLPKLNRKIPEHKITKQSNGIFEYLAIIKKVKLYV